MANRVNGHTASRASSARAVAGSAMPDQTVKLEGPLQGMRFVGGQQLSVGTTHGAPEKTAGAARHVGFVEAANHRLDSLTGRLSHLTGALSQNLDRMTGSQPAASDESGIDCPSGEIHLLHYRLSVLENVVEALDRQVSRTADL